MVEICSLEISIKVFMPYAQLFAEIVEHKTCHSWRKGFRCYSLPFLLVCLHFCNNETRSVSPVAVTKSALL